MVSLKRNLKVQIGHNRLGDNVGWSDESSDVCGCSEKGKGIQMYVFPAATQEANRLSDCQSVWLRGRRSDHPPHQD